MNAVVAAASTPSGHGLWLTSADGEVVALGDAYYHGSPAGELTEPVVDVLSTPGGRGYHLVTIRGNVHSFGDARAPAPATLEPQPVLEVDTAVE